MRIRGQASQAREQSGVYHYDPMVEAAWLYFKDGLPQHEIAQRLGVSRAKVSNLLAAARVAGVYRVSFDQDIFDQIGVAEALKERHGLDAALVVPSTGSLAERRARVASAGAWHLIEGFADCEQLGVCWGQTVLELGHALEPTETRIRRVCQMVGVARSELCKLAEACNSSIAMRLGADVLQFPAPGVVSSRRLFEDILAEPIVSEQFETMRALDAALFGVCSIKPDSPFFASGLARGIAPEQLLHDGVVGIVGGRMFRRDGSPVRMEGYDDRLLALELDELRRIPRRFGVAAGLEKADAIRGALRAGLMTALATDFDTACAILNDA